MNICPECKGQKEFKIPSGHPLHVYCEDGPVVYEIYVCSTCGGTGKVDDLTLAIYKARGGPAPEILMKGFA